MIDSAIILAAGFGRRLNPLTCCVPKVLAPFYGLPLLEHTLCMLRDYGVKRVVLNAHYRAPDLVNYIANRGTSDLDVEVVLEEDLLGTGGALGNLAERVDRASFVLNGDNLVRVDLSGVDATHRRGEAEITLGVLPFRGDRSGHRVEIDADDRVHRLVRVDLREDGDRVPPQGTRWVFNAGLMVVEPEFLRRLSRDPHGFEDDALPPMLDRGVAMAASHLDGDVIDLGNPQTFLRTYIEVLKDLRLLGEMRDRVQSVWGVERRLFVDEGKRFVWIASPREREFPNVVGSHSFLGARTRIGSGVRLQGSVILEGAQIGEGVELVDSLVGPGARVPAGARLEGAVIRSADNVRLFGDRLGARSEPGGIRRHG